MSRKKHSKIFKWLLGLGLAGAAIGLIAASIFIFWAASLKVPDFVSFEERKVAQSTKIYDRTGKILLWDVHQNIQRTVVPSEQISRFAKNATVAIEDSEFYQHHGINFKAIARAVFVNIKTMGFTQGFSTITQQLVKNTLLTREKAITRKLKEIIMALKIEKTTSKDKILELYLNEISYGGSNYGIEIASQNFFGTTAANLTLAQAAYLAAIPQAPSYYSPYGNHKKELDNRKNLVLKRMAELGFITNEEMVASQNEKVRFLSKEEKNIKAPHFSLFIRSYLEEKYGKDFVEENGLKVTTTLDFGLQQKAEEIVSKYAEENTKNFNAYNAGLFATDPKTGQILVMVGSKNWNGKSEPEGCVSGVDCKFEPKPNMVSYGIGRQPGSSIKPFVYATAFKKGYTPDTVVFDLATEFNSSCAPDGKPKPGLEIDLNDCYMPENYDHIYRGPVNLRNALAQSINVPAVKTLYLAGMRDSLKTIQDAGITRLNDPDRYGLTLVLGGGEVSLLEMVTGYGTLANNGVKNNPVSILKIEDSNGKTLESFYSRSEQVLDKNIALEISDILSDNEARTPAFGNRSHLYIPDRQVAVKTGTTNDYRDAWVLGYTPSLALGVWVGNNDNSSMEKKVAGFIAAPMWNEFIVTALKDSPIEFFEKPEKSPTPKPVLGGDWHGGQTYPIDSFSGKLATIYTPPEARKDKTLTQIHSILYWLDKNNPLGPQPEHPETDPQFLLWETPVLKWAQEQGIKDQTPEDIPKEYDDMHTPENAPKINIITPSPAFLYNPNASVNIKFSYQSKFGLSQADFFFNDTYLGSNAKEPFDFSFLPATSGEITSSSTIKIVIYDKVRNKTETIVPVNIK